MIITLKDGSQKEYAESKSVYEIALDISEGLARAACAGEVDGEVVDLRTVVERIVKSVFLQQMMKRDWQPFAIRRLMFLQKR